jgi:hypothetical protein
LVISKQSVDLCALSAVNYLLEEEEEEEKIFAL